METFAGSFAELKHDTILYSKAVMAEMGGGDDGEIVDDRGYVDPEPQVYSRFAALADQTATGLKGYGMLSGKAEEDLGRLKDIALKLLAISEKELRSEALSLAAEIVHHREGFYAIRITREVLHFGSGRQLSTELRTFNQYRC